VGIQVNEVDRLLREGTQAVTNSVDEHALQAFVAAADPPSVDAAWNAVMNEVLAVGKDDRFEARGQPGYNFRGVDAVVNAVGPALRKHGVTIHPKKVKKLSTVEYEAKSGARMVNKEVKVTWEVRGPRGDTFTGNSLGEASDSADKSLAKAQSVAYRVYLLQALCIPTGDRDPDQDVHERASYAASPEDIAAIAAANEARGELLAKMEPLGWTEELLVRRYWDDYRKNLRNTADVAMIRAFGEAINGVVAGTALTTEPIGDPQPEPPISEHTLRKLHTLLSTEKITERDERLKWCTDALGYEVTSTKNLTDGEGEVLIDKLQRLQKAQSAETGPK
jgi:hypothetical protein